MIDFKFQMLMQLNDLIKEVEKKQINPLKKAGYELMSYAKDLVGKPGDEKNHSKGGEPPSKRTGRLQANIKYQATNESVKIGILRDGFYGSILEKGGTFKVKKKTKKSNRVGQVRVIVARPFLTPTLEKNLPTISNQFGSFMN